MDEEFIRRWQAGLPPFDGVALWASAPTPLAILQAALEPAVEYLRGQWRQEVLFTIREEHHTDGVSFMAEPSAWEDLARLVSSPETLRASGLDESFVVAAFFPESRDFFLRIYVPKATDQPSPNEWIGGFDLTGADPLIARIETLMSETAPIDLDQEPAKQYHDEWWGG
jgi:hypothetical protein